MSLLPVAEALSRMLARANAIRDSETVELKNAAGRVLAKGVVSPRDQPPFPASAMDGYAVRSRDLPGRLRVVGEAAAGAAYEGTIGEGECCRIFTGATVPSGADTILIQEDAVRNGGWVQTTSTLQPSLYVRPQGLDYAAGELLLAGRTELTPAALALIASCGFATVDVIRRPRVLILMTGDELVLPGDTLDHGQIYGSNGIGVAAIVRAAGGNALDGGILPDDLGALKRALAESDADIVVTLGGASVGDHDLVRPALEAIGVRIDFMNLAMRPGKPVMFGTKGSQLYLGLPGNPVSSLVGAKILLVPLVRALLGLRSQLPDSSMPLAVDLPPNGPREHYMRATLDDDGVRPASNQDSSLLSVLARADCLLVRPAGEPARKAGESVTILPL